jgi:hypothetical protein
MFGVFYIAMAFAAVRIIAAKDKGRPHRRRSAAISRCQRRRSR